MYKNILMPVDVFEMDLSDKAVRHAASLAKAEGASITLVNILPASSRSLLRGFNAGAAVKLLPARCALAARSDY